MNVSAISYMMKDIQDKRKIKTLLRVIVDVYTCVTLSDKIICTCFIIRTDK